MQTCEGRVEKVLDRNRIDFRDCINKLTHGANNNPETKELTLCSISFIEKREEGELLWPCENVACVCGSCINIFCWLHWDYNFENKFLESRSHGRIGLISIKKNNVS